MSELRLHKLVCQIVCTEHDDDGNVIGERAVGEGTFFPSHLGTIEEQVRVAIEQANGPPLSEA